MFSAVLTLCQAQNHISAEIHREISFYTPDSIKIYGDLYELDKASPVILLFHQGGSNARGEYKTIIPRLLKMGYNILATDQRKGGQYYGEYNRTLAGTPDYQYGDPYTYCDAYNNLNSALNFIIDEGFSGAKILWGSSYSAALVIQMASKRPEDIQGVLAFSPASGKPMEGCNPEPYLEQVACPLLILSPPDEIKGENATKQFALAKQHGHQTYAPEYGVHGSSMLVRERVGHEVEATWEVVTSFLRTINQ